MLDQDELDDVFSMHRDIIRQSELRNLAYDKYYLVQDYLDEKGVDYESHFHMPVNDESTTFSCLLVDVPVQLYHKVVVPGILEICKKEKMTFLPWDYLWCTNNARSIKIQFRVRRDDKPNTKRREIC